MIRTTRLHLETKGNTEVIDLTPEVRRAVAESGLSQGTVILFAVGSTAALTTIEHEPGLLEDLRELVQRLIPQEHPYRHNQRWGEDNGHAHLRASLVGPCLTVPFVEKRLALGTWQQIVFLDFDVRPRSREVVLQLQGE